MPPTVTFPLTNSAYTHLPESFFQRALPTPVKSPAVVLWNSALAHQFGIDACGPDALGTILGGNEVVSGATPIAAAYAGHQFGHFVPQLGDGRAIVLGELKDRHGVAHELQLKGAGRTAFSRGGDGRAAVGPVIREYLASEAMHALGIPTTRALAATITGEAVFREKPLPGAVLTRVARSHVRVGTFQYFAARRDFGSVRKLADYMIERFFPAAAGDSQRYRAFFLLVRDAQAALVSRWMQVGFIHGVMNTDNMSILGDTIDYGPCAFMDAYDPATVYSAIDRHGRYAYANQPSIAAWNLARFAETMLQLFDPDQAKALAWAQDAIGGFEPAFRADWLAGMRAKIGLTTEHPGDDRLIEDLLGVMQSGRADYTLSFRRLATVANGIANPAFIGLFRQTDPIETWLARWWQRLKLEGRPLTEIERRMTRVNPAFILRNHRVEWAIDAAVERDDFSLARELHSVLADPFEDRPEYAGYQNPPAPGDWKCQTFCGT